MNYLSMTKPELEVVKSAEEVKHRQYAASDFSLDISRGKPSGEQLNLSLGMLDCVTSASSCKSASGADCRNYGGVDGIPEMKAIFSNLLDIPENMIIIGGNSSLNMMYDAVARAMLYGTCDSERPWCREEKIKFLCPAPGYDRHFRICESLGIEMINITMTGTGPDMDEVQRYALDPAVRGMWCVPKYSNPTGITYSDETVKAIASMKCVAPDFRVFWDNAYAVHDIYEQGDTLLDIFAECKKCGNENRVFYFSSTSKITFSGAGVAMVAMSAANKKHEISIISAQTIGPDKMSQLAHAKFLIDKDHALAHMKKHAALLRVRFDAMIEIMDRELIGLGIAEWTRPKGGYFISLEVLPGCARRVYELAKAAGVTLTDAGATFPYGKDEKDSNLRLAPSFTTIKELVAASEILCCCVKIACAEQLLLA